MFCLLYPFAVDGLCLQQINKVKHKWIIWFENAAHDENNDVIDFVQFDRWFCIKVYSRRKSSERKKNNWRGKKITQQAQSLNSNDATLYVCPAQVYMKLLTLCGLRVEELIHL